MWPCMGAPETQMLVELAVALLSVAVCAEIKEPHIFPRWAAIVNCCYGRRPCAPASLLGLLGIGADTGETAVVAELSLGCHVGEEEARAVEYLKEQHRGGGKVGRYELRTACWLTIMECYNTSNAHGPVLLRELLGAGADPSETSMAAALLLNCCAYEEEWLAVGYIRVLHEYGVGITEKHIQHACLSGRVDVFRCLVDLNPGLVFGTEPGLSALSCALGPKDLALSTKRVMVGHLFEMGARPRYDDLRFLRACGQIEELQMVLEHPELLFDQEVLDELLLAELLLESGLRHAGADEKFLAVAGLLFKHGARPNAAAPKWTDVLGRVIANDRFRQGLWLLLRGMTIPPQYFTESSSPIFTARVQALSLITKLYDRHMLLLTAAIKEQGSCIFQLPLRLFLALTRLLHHVHVDSALKCS